MKNWPWQKKVVKLLELGTGIVGIVLAAITDLEPAWWVAITSAAFLIEEWILSNFPTS